MLVDSHCHLNYPELSTDLQATLKRAEAMGVSTCLTINTRLAEAPTLIQMAEANPMIFTTVGVHPCEVVETGIASYETLLKLSQHPKVVGLGETGLDAYHDVNQLEPQQESLRIHMAVAKKTGLPLVIHSREAEDALHACLIEMKGIDQPGVIHCFTGTRQFAFKALDLGFFISFSGILTFKNARALQELVRDIPRDRLLVETDAPYLAPVPKRGKPNEPAYVRYTAEKMAELLGLSFEEVAQLTSDNFFRLFSKAKMGDASC